MTQTRLNIPLTSVWKPTKMKRTFVVKFGTIGDTGTWSASYKAENFAEAEWKALETLAQNEDSRSYIQQIELW